MIMSLAEYSQRNPTEIILQHSLIHIISTLIYDIILLYKRKSTKFHTYYQHPLITKKYITEDNKQYHYLGRLYIMPTKDVGNWTYSFYEFCFSLKIRVLVKDATGCRVS